DLGRQPVPLHRGRRPHADGAHTQCAGWDFEHNTCHIAPTKGIEALFEYVGKIGVPRESRLLKNKGRGPIGIECVRSETGPDTSSRGKAYLFVGLSLRKWLTIRAGLCALTCCAKHGERLFPVGGRLAETKAVTRLFNRISVRVELKLVDHVWMEGGG